MFFYFVITLTLKNINRVNTMKEKLFGYLPFLLIGALFFFGGIYLIVVQKGINIASCTLLGIGFFICIAFYMVAKTEVEAERARKKEWDDFNRKYGGKR